MTAPETAAPTPSTPRGAPVVSDAVRIVKAMFSPGDVYEEVRPWLPFWGPWLVVTVIFAIAQFLMGPYQMRVQELAMTAAGREVPASMGMFKWIGLAFTPVITLLLSLIAALVLWVAVSVTGGEGRYKQMMTINIFAWGPICIQQFVMFVVLKMRGLGAIRAPADLQVPLGVDLLLAPETTGFVRGLAAGINPFSIWGLVITAVGVQVLLRMEKGKAWTAAIMAFAVSLLVGAGLTAMFTPG